MCHGPKQNSQKCHNLQWHLPQPKAAAETAETATAAVHDDRLQHQLQETMHTLIGYGCSCDTSITQNTTPVAGVER